MTPNVSMAQVPGARSDQSKAPNFEGGDLVGGNFNSAAAGAIGDFRSRIQERNNGHLDNRDREVLT
eukprot:CAMPEP_0170483934 /NCGR_PEP_ID=MMETSP0208-20121228/3503_1 /TAXON_ID=197538 /ORGANISM="Strombidium inclinatum, Strain S3" /LENGTH=65 /DNA_ID=CAMNT_0010757129 /DNA_START=11 /DNA_END=208 /DNA_ORIENTATION=+